MKSDPNEQEKLYTAVFVSCKSVKVQFHPEHERSLASFFSFKAGY